MSRNIVVCCDGTWCGDAAGTTSNVKIIAEMFAGQVLHEDVHGVALFTSGARNFVRYSAGVGVAVPGDNWWHKVWEGTVATSISEHCVAAYKFIAEYYRPDDKIWLFGMSRGAHTVRCVAGIINNCGIPDSAALGGELDRVCKRAYSLYTSDRVKPHSQEAQTFERLYSHPRRNQPPIRFMGLFDTVGALGVPKMNPSRSKSLSYEFYDTHVSSEVEEVFQALALDDQLSLFTPCRVDPWKPNASRRNYLQTQFSRQEIWFPGAHFDIGRQNFVPDAIVNGGLSETLQPKIKYNPLFANPPLVEMVNRIHNADNTAGVAAMDLYKLPAALWENNTPWMWDVERHVPGVRTYESPVVPENGRDPVTGMILTGPGRRKTMGVYAHFLYDWFSIPTAMSRLVGWFKDWPLIGGVARSCFALPDFAMYLIIQSFITDRQPQPEAGDVIRCT